MAIKGVNVGAVALMGGGLLFVWSAFHGASLTGSLRDLLQGKQPSGSDLNAIQGSSGSSSGSSSSGGNSGLVAAAGSGSATDGHAALNQAAKAYGWDTGAEWDALQYVEMREAGFNPYARNPSSGAYGMAQSLGHPFPGGPASNGVNEYGGFGLTAAESRQASEGNAYWQAVWMVNYIKARYGDPIAAANHERNFNWY